MAGEIQGKRRLNSAARFTDVIIMTIIRFPGGAQRLPANTDDDPNLRLSVGPVRFTCTSCGDETVAEFRNMVFRSLEFYCLTCGTPFKIRNPAFYIQTRS